MPNHSTSNKKIFSYLHVFNPYQVLFFPFSPFYITICHVNVYIDNRISTEKETYLARLYVAAKLPQSAYKFTSYY